MIKKSNALPEAVPTESTEISITSANTLTIEVTDIKEIGGPKGLDPTRFGDWSVNGRCIDF